MAITLRNTKGSALTHTELDNNFREFYYSASYNDFELQLFKSTSLEDEFKLPVNVGKGPALSIQVKSGSALTGSEATVTGSSNFTFDFGSNILNLTGSGNITGNLTVGGVVTAERFHSEVVSSSIIFESGSTKFGDSADDTHVFTGSMLVVGTVDVSTGITGSDLKIDDWNSVSGSLSGHNTRITTLESSGIVSSSAQIAGLGAGILSSSAGISNLGAGILSSSAQIASEISGSYVLTNAKVQALGASIASSSAQVVSLIENQNVNLGIVSASSLYTAIVSSSVVYSSGSNIFGDASDDKHEFTGSVAMSSTLAIAGFPNVSASLASVVGSSGISNVSEDTTPQLGGNLDLNSNNISGSGTIDISGNISGSALKITGEVDAASGSFSGPISGSSLDINGDITGSNLLINGTIDATGDITAFYSSDERLKDNVTPLSNALDKVNQIGGYEFDWNNNSSNSGHDVGVIAQEIEKVLPEVVAQRDNGYLAVRCEKIVALLIQAIKEQQSQIDDLKSRLD